MIITKGMASSVGLITKGYGMSNKIKEIIKFISNITKNVIYKW